MPVNKGGNRAKKGKNSGGDNVKDMIDWDFANNEMPGRILRSLGSKRFEVYCNDDKTRICKLRGTIRKNEWVEKGSIVILSRRLFSVEMGSSVIADAAESDTDSDDDDFAKKTEADLQKHTAKQMTETIKTDEKEVGDILGLINSVHYGKLKKMPGVNSILFVEIESQDDKSMKKIKDKLARGVPDDDDTGFQFDYDEDEKESPEKPADLTKEDFKTKHKEAEIKRSNDRATKEKFIKLDDL